MRLGALDMALYSVASIGAGAFYAFNNFVLPLLLKAVNAPDLAIGLLSSTRSIEGAVIQPTVGAWSDRIWTPLGRRRPFMLVAIPLSALFFVAAPFVDGLLQLAIVIFLFSIFFNVAIDPYAALLPDIAPPDQRGLLSGISSGVQLLSQVAFLGVVALAVRAGGGGAVPPWTYVLLAVVLVASFGLTVATVRERRELTTHAERLPLRAYVEALLTHRQAMRYLGTVFVYQFGFSAVLPYLTPFIVDDIHQSQDVALILSALALLVTAFGAVGFGRLADRIGSRPVLATGWGLLALAAFGGTVIVDLPQTVVVVVLAGLGNAAATAVKWPLLTLLIPPQKTGVFAGLIAAADSIAIPLSVFVAAEVFLPRFGYRGVFSMLAINIVLALLLLLRFVEVPRPARSAAAPAQ